MPQPASYSSADLYEKDVFQLVGLNDLPAEQRQAMLANMTKIIEGRVIARVLDILTPAERQRLEQATDANYDQTMRDCLVAHKLTIDELAAEESVLLKMELTEVAADNKTK